VPDKSSAVLSLSSSIVAWAAAGLFSPCSSHRSEMDDDEVRIEEEVESFLE
jgi:hypothetical protein